MGRTRKPVDPDFAAHFGMFCNLIIAGTVIYSVVKIIKETKYVPTTTNGQGN